MLNSVRSYVCRNCGRDFTPDRLRGNRVPQFCSRRCSNRLVTDETRQRQSEAKAGKLPWNKGVQIWADREHPRGTLGKTLVRSVPCSDETRRRLSESHRGRPIPKIRNEGHWNWQGGKSSIEERTRKRAECQEWRRQVLERDKFTCQRCGSTELPMQVHHIKSFAEFPELRTDLDNGEAICGDCHANEHGTRYSRIALNTCPTCEKRIKSTAKFCRECGKAETERKNKAAKVCSGCGGIKQKAVSAMCRSCAAKARKPPNATAG